MSLLFTIGYERRTVAELLEVLAEAGVTALVDVRDVAWSHKPGFSRRDLESVLPAGGVRYAHAKFAGNPKRLRDSSASTPEALATYARHLDDHPEIEQEFCALVASLEAEGRRVSIMCFERDPADCHRSVLAGRWKAREAGEVVHLGVDAEQPGLELG